CWPGCTYERWLGLRASAARPAPRDRLALDRRIRHVGHRPRRRGRARSHPRRLHAGVLTGAITSAMTDAVDERAEAARARDAAAGAAPARDERPSTDARRQNADAQRPAIEVGWVLVGPVEPRVSDAVRQAIERFEAFARERWPGFAWG